MIRASRTHWGGVVDDAKRATGFFRTEQIDGIWWLIDPDGGRFLSKGVNTVRFDQDRVQNTDRIPYAEACKRKFGDQGAWRAAAARRLLSWGFNSLGCWSDGEVANAGSSPLATTPIVDLGAMFISEQSKTFQLLSYDAFPDVFNPDFDLFVRGAATTHISSRRNEPNIIGWFTDNELRWGPDWRGHNELLTMFLNYPAGMLGRRMATTMLEQRYRDFDSFKAVWSTPARSWDQFRKLASHEQPFGQTQDRGTKNSLDDDKRLAFAADCEAFAAAAADRYFEATVAAVKAAAPNHLALGCRFAIAPRRAVIEAASRHLDVITFNCYDRDPARALEVYSRAGKPVLIGEFSFRGDDSGLPNTNGAGPRVLTQADRARGFEHYASVGLRHPKLVGYHWFEHADQPVEGRFDGENSNFGTVTINDDEYESLTQAMTALNEKAEEIHAQAIPHRE